MFEPSYIELHKTGKLKSITTKLNAIYENCTLCPRNCGVNRRKGEKGICGAGVAVKVSSAAPHFGEERPLVGYGGSGTIFFAHCNLLCVFCQNWDISHSGEGREISDQELAAIMLQLQGIGCHNINFVTPTHYLPNIINALGFAVEKGLNIPLVYNTGGYDNISILRMLDGIIDIYLPDYKYSDEEVSAKFSYGAKNYPEKVKAALKEMHRQVGLLKTDKNNIALHGLMIRHLVMPNGVAGTKDFANFVANELNPGTYVNIMAQYRPCFRAHQYPGLSTGLNRNEYHQALTIAREYGLYNLD